MGINLLMNRGEQRTIRTRINNEIRVPEVRLVSHDGEQIGVTPTQEALRIASSQDLDLVEVAPQAKPPVCKLMDYSKYKYELEQKAKKSKKHQTIITIKEMKLRPKIDNHDYETKKKHIVRFLNAGAKVKVTIMFRGREMAHVELGEKILLRITDELQELASVESRPKLDGRNMIMILNPIPQKVEVPSKNDLQTEVRTA